MHPTPSHHIWRRTLSVATSFWAACLVLVAVEAAVGSNLVVGVLFFLSIPALVGCLTWVHMGIVFGEAPASRSLSSVFVLGASVLLSASVIILVGLLAAANLKELMTGV